MSRDDSGDIKVSSPVRVRRAFRKFMNYPLGYIYIFAYMSSSFASSALRKFSVDRREIERDKLHLSDMYIAQGNKRSQRVVQFKIGCKDKGGAVSHSPSLLRRTNRYVSARQI